MKVNWKSYSKRKIYNPSASISPFMATRQRYYEELKPVPYIDVKVRGQVSFSYNIGRQNKFTTEV